MTQVMQCNVARQTSSEYCRLMVPSGRTLNYVSFTQKIQIPETFGSPVVHSNTDTVPLFFTAVCGGIPGMVLKLSMVY
jgi:hypothetical protein